MLSPILICVISVNKKGVCLFLSIIKLIDLERVIWLSGVTAPLNNKDLEIALFCKREVYSKFIAGDQGSECLDSERTCNCVNNGNKKYKT